MKRLIAIFAVVACVTPCVSWSAVNVKSSGVKKAAPVATKQTDKMESVTSLLPTVIGLVGSVQSLNKQQQQLSADCAPTSDELNTVNDLVKEWAKLGSVSAETAVSGLGDGPCTNEEGKTAYETRMQEMDADESCYDIFNSSSDKNMIWYKFPKASKAKKCDVVNDTKCTDYVSNIYDVYAKISFSDEDLTKSELSKIAKLREKAERCAPGKINAAKRELYGGFLTQTLNSVGQSTGASGTSSVLETVSSMGGSGNVQSMLPSLGSMAGQLFDK